jgi:hypothetical protein
MPPCECLTDCSTKALRSLTAKPSVVQAPANEIAVCAIKGGVRLGERIVLQRSLDRR